MEDAVFIIIFLFKYFNNYLIVRVRFIFIELDKG